MAGSATQATGAIVVGAGGGRRLGGIEKAFMELAGRPLIAHCVAVLERSAEVDAICLVVSAESVGKARALSERDGWRKVRAIVPGGAERQDSVRAGLDALAECEWVLVHDAARPLLNEALITVGLTTARRTGAAIAATPVRDTLKRAAGSGDFPEVSETVDRAGLWAAQTPQIFRAALLRDAFARVGPRAAQLTDDAAVVQAAGHRVALYPGDPQNVKVTLPEDVPLVEALLAWRARR
ncbi:MAG TPA: 2-C-methyl-D-erythritol 4-phosphate cytidylyltransferase [Chloroflexota bacterium]|jgi:2-C-methyl-D-erythritol 4-phosphate cytidylyltransferase|nr:2-C-methyl-D-erythritol 4-phosphate cytidylyltransferase [Chloroflexota bacterium]